MTDTKIYVASLSDYNAGRLYGVSIPLDETTDVDDVWAAINAMLAASPEYRAFPQGGPAEEWAIHDFEGFGGYIVGEGDDIEKVVEIARIVSGPDGEAFAAWLGNGNDVDEEAFRESFEGEWEDEDSYARYATEELGLPGIGLEVYVNVGFYGSDPKAINIVEALDHFLDWGAITRSYFNGDCWSADLKNGNVAVFRAY